MQALFDTPSVSVLLYAHVVERVVHEALKMSAGTKRWRWTWQRPAER